MVLHKKIREKTDSNERAKSVSCRDDTLEKLLFSLRSGLSRAVSSETKNKS